MSDVMDVVNICKGSRGIKPVLVDTGTDTQETVYIEDTSVVETMPGIGMWPKENPYIQDARDPVNHPGHYESGKFECIDVMLETQGKEAVMGFCICNAFKYLYRHRRKNGIEDVKKAVWYLNKHLELAEGDA